jgi:sugar phosphate isomerase/epimerase
MPTLDRLCIHQVCVMERWTLPEFIAGMRRHGVPAVAIWRDSMKKHGAKETRRLIDDAGLSVTSLCAAGFVSTADLAEAHQAMDEVRRAIDEAAAIGARTLMFITGGIDPRDKDIAATRSRCLDRLRTLGAHARAASIKLAIEPLHPMAAGTRSLVSTLGIANDWCDALADDAVFGIAVDTYAVWWDPDLPRQIARAGQRICNFHIDDWLADTRDLRLDRGMMGDGLIDIRGIRRLVEAAGYDGFIEVEIFSERDWWKRDPDEVVSTIKERFVTVV